MDNCKIRKLTDHKTVMRFVNSVDIGKLDDIPRAKKTKFDKKGCIKWTVKKTRVIYIPLFLDVLGT